MTAVARKGSGPRKEGDADTRSRSHEPPDNQPSQPSMESEHSLGLPDNETSMNIPASSVPPLPPL